MRDFFQNLTSSSYERYFFPTSSGGRITYGIYIYRETDGKDGWHIRKGSYYTSDLKAAKEGRNDWLKYLGKAELDADICELIFSKVKELKKEATEKLVLDACCGPKMFWFDKNDPNVLYVDKRKVENEIIWTNKDGKQIRRIDIMPDVVADFRKMPFADESFYHVVFDPPHLVNVGDKAYMFKKYGRLPKDWQCFLKKGFSECWRVLKVNGTLVFKWNAVQIPTEKIVEAIGRKPLYGNKCGRQNKTHWMVFFKEAK